MRPVRPLPYAFFAERVAFLVERRCPRCLDVSRSLAYGRQMRVGDRIDETGMLLLEGGGFILRRDGGGRFLLDLRRAPVDEVSKRVRVIGTLVGQDFVDVDGVSLA